MASPDVEVPADHITATDGTLRYALTFLGHNVVASMFGGSGGEELAYICQRCAALVVAREPGVAIHDRFHDRVEPAR